MSMNAYYNLTFEMKDWEADGNAVKRHLRLEASSLLDFQVRMNASGDVLTAKELAAVQKIMEGMKDLHGGAS